MAAAGKLGVRYRALAVSAEGVSTWVPDPRLAAAADRDGGRDAVARGKGSGHRKKKENLQRMRDRRPRCWAVRSAGLAKPVSRAVPQSRSGPPLERDCAGHQRNPARRDSSSRRVPLRSPRRSGTRRRDSFGGGPYGRVPLRRDVPGSPTSHRLSASDR